MSKIKPMNTKLTSQFALTIVIGNFAEYFAFSTYVFFADAIAQSFFPVSDSSSRAFYSYIIFVIAFVFRPVGGFTFGILGDFKSRKTALSYTTFCMSLGVLVIALAPTYEQIGVAAPILLIVGRLLQSLSIGGEYTGSLINVQENTPRHLHAFWGSLITAAGVVGWIAGLGVNTFLLHYDLVQAGWRITFILSACIGVIGFYIRSFALPEDVRPRKAQRISHYFTDFRNVRLSRLLAILLLGSNVGGLFYTMFVFPRIFGPEFTSLTAADIQPVLIIGISLCAILEPVFGRIADVFKCRRHMILFSAIALIIGSFPLISLILSEYFWMRVYGIALTACIMSLLMSGIAGTMIHLLPVAVRFRGVSFFYNLGNGTMALFASVLGTQIVAYNLGLAYVSYFLIGCGSIGVLSYYLMGKQSE